MIHEREDYYSTLESLHHDHYTVDELARLLDMGKHVIEHAVYSGDLKAFVVDHQIIDILRSDVLEWLANRQ